MDWNAAVERQREALLGILAALVAMAGLGGGTAPTSPLRGGRRDLSAEAQRAKAEAESGGGGELANTPTRRSDDRRPPRKAEVRPEVRPTLPRHLHRAVLRLLRPAEAAARRLIIALARGLVVQLPRVRPRKAKPKPKSVAPVLRSLGIAVVLPHNVPYKGGPEPRACRGVEGEPRRTPARTIALPLFDPLRVSRPGRRHYVPPHAAPRILSFDGARPHRLPPPPSPHDPVDATRLTLRLQALAAALDDLPARARRFARWRAARDAAGAQDGQRRPPRRVTALRPGRPPGWRRRPDHEVHEVLNEAHWLALRAMERRDTS